MDASDVEDNPDLEQLEKVAFPEIKITSPVIWSKTMMEIICKDMFCYKDYYFTRPQNCKFKNCSLICIRLAGEIITYDKHETYKFYANR